MHGLFQYFHSATADSSVKAMSGDASDMESVSEGAEPNSDDVNLETYLKDKTPTLNQFLGPEGGTLSMAGDGADDELDIAWEDAEISIDPPNEEDNGANDQSGASVDLDPHADPDVPSLESSGESWILPDIEDEPETPLMIMGMPEPDPNAPPKEIPDSTDDIDLSGLDLEFFEGDAPPSPETNSGGEGETDLVLDDEIVSDDSFEIELAAAGEETQDDLAPPLTEPSATADEEDALELSDDDFDLDIEMTDDQESEEDLGPPLPDPSVTTDDEDTLELSNDDFDLDIEMTDGQENEEDLGPPLPDPSVPVDSDDVFDLSDDEIDLDVEVETPSNTATPEKIGGLDADEVAKLLGEAPDSEEDLDPPLPDPSVDATPAVEAETVNLEEADIVFDDLEGEDEDLGPPLPDPSADAHEPAEPDDMEAGSGLAADEVARLLGEAPDLTDPSDDPGATTAMEDETTHEADLEEEGSEVVFDTPMDNENPDPPLTEASVSDDMQDAAIPEEASPPAEGDIEESEQTGLAADDIAASLGEQPDTDEPIDGSDATPDDLSVEVSGDTIDLNDDQSMPATDRPAAEEDTDTSAADTSSAEETSVPEETAGTDTDESAPTINPAAATAAQLLADAIALHRNGDLEGAARGYEALARKDPGNSACWINLGIVLRRLGHSNAAITCLRRGVGLNPKDGAAWSNLGNALRAGNQLEDAKRAQIQAISLSPGAPQIHYNLGLVLRDFGDLEEAAHAFHRAELLGYKNPDLAWDQSLNMMLGGDLKGGFETYDARFGLSESVERFSELPRWTGDPCTDKTILVHAEQGLGDSLQFCRYVPLLKDFAQHVVFDLQPPLARLLESSPDFAGIELHPRDGSTPDADLQIPLLTVPKYFSVEEGGLPGRSAYLAAPEEGPRLSDYPGQRKVGIAWAGKPTHKNDHNRSVGLKPFIPLMDHPLVRFFGLQLGPEQQQIRDLSLNALVEDLSPYIRDFADTASILQDLDLVITVDTSVAHVAGALGKSVWVLLPFAPDWRWQLRRDDSPWYPSMRLFRQTSPGDWDDVFMRVRTELVKWARGQ